jgi:hypothetical protein
MAIFSSGQQFVSAGYKVLFQHRLLPTVSGIVDPEQAAKEEAKVLAGLSPFGDPRGLLKAGMLPASKFSYRVFVQTLEPVISGSLSILTEAAGGIGSLLLQNLPEVVIARTTSRTAIVIFEGRDVIDMETKDLKTDGDAIIVPDRVFRAIHASNKPLVESGDDIATNSARAYALPRFKGNVVNGVALTEGAPRDTILAAQPQGRLATDSASNKIRLTGSAALVSYVAMVKPLFRDVVTITASSQGIGVVRIPDGLIITDTSAGQTRDAFVLRFSMVNVALAGQDEVLQWRLSESYGVNTTKTVEKTPSGLLKNLSKDELTKNALQEVNKHYVYNLSDLDAADTTDEQFSKPAKDAVSPLLARAKMDPNSPFFDKGFSAKIVGFEIGQGATGRLVEVLGVGLPTSGSALVPQLMYTSPNFEFDLPPATRIGYEYTLRQPNRMTVLTGPRDAVLLARTVESAPGLAVSYDCCLHKVHVFQSASSPAGPTMLERWFDDALWQKPTDKPPKAPDSKLETFLVGEYPFVSEGRATLLPLQTLLEEAVSGDNVVLPASFYVTSIVVTVPGEMTDAGVVRLYESTQAGKPLFEAAVKSSASGGELTIGTPPIRFSSWDATGGLSLKQVAGVKKGDGVLEALSGDKASTDPTEFQLANVEKQEFPIEGGNVAATGDCTSGWTLLAFENENRLDMAIRTVYSKPFQLVRDVVWRIPKNIAASSKSKSDLPSASLPFLLSDVDTDSSYLFYVYKQKLLVKVVPMKIFRGPDVASPILRYDAKGEAEVAAKLHKLGAALVYDGSSKGKLDELAIDLDKNAIKIVDDPNPPKDDKPRPITQYSAMQDSAGNVYVFIQADDIMVVRRSHNLGSGWTDVLPRSFSFIPAKSQDEKLSERTALAPFVLYDWATNIVSLFFLFESSLMFVRFPGDKLRNLPSDKLAEEMGKIKPQVVVGALSKNMADRGITRNVGVEKKQGATDKKPPKLSPHRVTGVVSAEGYYRVWFKDEDEALRSLISTDTGNTWRDERDALEDVS